MPHLNLISNCAFCWVRLSSRQQPFAGAEDLSFSSHSQASGHELHQILLLQALSCLLGITQVSHRLWEDYEWYWEQRQDNYWVYCSEASLLDENSKTTWNWYWWRYPFITLPWFHNLIIFSDLVPRRWRRGHFHTDVFVQVQGVAKEAITTSTANLKPEQNKSRFGLFVELHWFPDFVS